MNEDSLSQENQKLRAIVRALVDDLVETYHHEFDPVFLADLVELGLA